MQGANTSRAWGNHSANMPDRSEAGAVNTLDQAKTKGAKRKSTQSLGTTDHSANMPDQREAEAANMPDQVEAKRCKAQTHLELGYICHANKPSQNEAEVEVLENKQEPHHWRALGSTLSPEDKAKTAKKLAEAEELTDKQTMQRIQWRGLLNVPMNECP